MDRSRHGPLRSYRSVDSWPSLRPVTTGKRTSPWLTLPPQLNAHAACASTSLSLAAASSMRTKSQRAGHVRHYGHRCAGAAVHGDSTTACDLGTFHFCQFSDDSGFSSCGSSASSVADEFEAPGYLLSVSKTPFFPQRSTRWSAAQICGAQSDTVASVLAAGVSDSEETDHCESDDDFDTIVMDRMKCNRFYSPLLKTHSSWPRCPSSLSKSHPLSKKQGEHTLKEKLQFNHFGRDILDLGTNLMTTFPLKATELPEKNLSLFLQNRSQYHRLGKFGTVEKLLFAKCKKECGFTFPVPPGEYGERLS